MSDQATASPPSTDSDAQLVERAVAGDQRAYELLVIKYQRRIERLIGRMVRDVMTESALQSADDDDETSRHENALTSESTPESELAAREIAAAVNAAMEALPDDLRQAVTLREIEGLSYEEIADAMNCPIGTVRSRIFRAREAISAKVKPLLSHQTGKRW